MCLCVRLGTHTLGNHAYLASTNVHKTKRKRFESQEKDSFACCKGIQLNSLFCDCELYDGMSVFFIADKTTVLGLLFCKCQTCMTVWRISHPKLTVFLFIFTRSYSFYQKKHFESWSMNVQRDCFSWFEILTPFFPFPPSFLTVFFWFKNKQINSRFLVLGALCCLISSVCRWYYWVWNLCGSSSTAHSCCHTIICGTVSIGICKPVNQCALAVTICRSDSHLFPWLWIIIV